MPTPGKRRRTKAVIAALALGMAFQLFGTNRCSEYATFFGLTAVDFCSVLNCSGGTFFNFCEPVALLIDCPQLAADGG